MPTRHFTPAELANLGVPPSDPTDVEHDPDPLQDRDEVAPRPLTAPNPPHPEGSFDVSRRRSLRS